MSEEEILKSKLKVSAILFSYNVPVEEAKIIGTFIEELQQENSQLKERIEKAIEYIEENKLNTNKISEMLCGSEVMTLLEILEGDE